VHHGALAYLLGINALRASEAAAVRIEDYADTLRGYRVLHLVGKGNKPATMPLTVPVLRVLETCRGQRTSGPLILRPISGRPIDRRDVYRMVARIAKTAGIPRHISPHSLRHAAITNALDAGVPLRDAQILARHADPLNHRALRPSPRKPRLPRRPLPHRLRRRRLICGPPPARFRPQWACPTSPTKRAPPLADTHDLTVETSSQVGRPESANPATASS
jgi:integrase